MFLDRRSQQRFLFLDKLRMELYKRNLEIAEKISDGLKLPSEFVIDQYERIVLAHALLYDEQKYY